MVLLDLVVLELRLDAGVYLCTLLGMQDCAQVAGSKLAARKALLNLLEATWAENPAAPIFQLHRLSSFATAQAETVAISFGARERADAPNEHQGIAHQGSWRDKVQMNFDAFWIAEAKDRNHAVLPALGLHVLCQNRLEIQSVLQQHANLLAHRKLDGLDLRKLARLEALSHPETPETCLPNRFRETAATSVGNEGGLAFTLTRLRHEIRLANAKQRELMLEGADPQSVLKQIANDVSHNTARVFHLDAEITRIAECFSADHPRSVLLIGPSGCGKTSAFLGLAQRSAQSGATVGTTLAGAGFYQTSGAQIIAGQSGFGMWQQRCQNLVKELAGKMRLGDAKKRITILHLGPLLELMEVGRTRAGEQSVAGFLRPEIARGNVLCVAECTPEQYQVIHRSEPGMLSAFDLVWMQAPNSEKLAKMIDAEAESLLGQTRAQRPAAAVALELVRDLHQRYAGYSAMPAKALNFVRGLASELGAEEALVARHVTERFIAETGLPKLLLQPEMRFDAEKIRQWFSARVIGQAPSVAAVVDRLAQLKAGLSRAGRPLASMMLIGPTGVGKTELAKTLAQFLFGSAERLSRFDLSQVVTAAAVQKLIGMQGMGDSEGLLTAKVREQPFSVLLLDEFEKAHASFFDLLLQVLGDGRLTDGAGRVADFSNTVILLTSNLGSTAAARSLGFSQTPLDAAAHYQQALQKFLRPELLNRFDLILPFARLSEQSIELIAARELQLLSQRRFFLEHQLRLEVSPDALKQISAAGFDPEFGARALKRSIERQLSMAIAQLWGQPGEEARPLAASRTITIDVVPQGQADLQDRRLQARFGAVEPVLTSANPMLHAAHARRLREQFDALLACDKIQSLVDEAALLEQQLQRAKRRRKPAPGQLLQRYSALAPRLAQLRRDIESACKLEDHSLAPLLARAIEPEQLDKSRESGTADKSRESGTADKSRESGTADKSRESGTADKSRASGTADASSLVALQRALDAHKMAFLRLLPEHSEADRFAFVVIADHGDWLQRLLAGYQQAAKHLGLSLELHAVIERPNEAKKPTQVHKQLLIWPVNTLKWPFDDLNNAQEMFTKPTRKCLGAVLLVNGELARPLFASEAGLHLYRPLKETGNEQCALVAEYSKGFVAPSDWARPARVAQLNVAKRRLFNVERREFLEYADVSLSGGTEPNAPAQKIVWEKDVSAAMVEGIRLRFAAMLDGLGTLEPWV